jgi:hypothetical protein
MKMKELQTNAIFKASALIFILLTVTQFGESLIVFN